MVYTITAIVLYPFCTKDQMSLVWAILKVRNPAETIGSFWYIMLEMFQERLEFVRVTYLLFQMVSACFLSQMVAQTSLVIKMLEQN